MIGSTTERAVAEAACLFEGGSAVAKETKRDAVRPIRQENRFTAVSIARAAVSGVN